MNPNPAGPETDKAPIQPGSDSGKLGSPHLHLRSCESTNTLAKQLATGGAVHGTTITTEQQSAGRGRQGRSWVAPPQSALLVSIIVRPYTAVRRFSPLAAALAVAETCELLADVNCLIKWPNDVWIDGRKVAGILIEAHPVEADPNNSWLVVGVGLNTSVSMDEMPPDLQQTATSLCLPRDTDTLSPLLARLDHWIDSPIGVIHDAWQERDALLAHRINWNSNSGTANGIDDEGNLRVKLDDGTETVLFAGEVHLT